MANQYCIHGLRKKTLNMDIIHFFPFFIINIIEILCALDELWQNERTNVPPYPVEILEAVVEINRLFFDDMVAALMPLPQVFQALFPHGHGDYDEVCPVLANNPTEFWYFTGETVASLTDLVHDLNLPMRVPGRPATLTLRDQILMTFIWLRQYPTFDTLAKIFNITKNMCRSMVTKYVFIMTPLLVQEIQWHNPQVWRSFRGHYDDFPDAVSLMDCTPIRISVPTGGCIYMYAIINPLCNSQYY
jgi:hypothetical protein